MQYGKAMLLRKPGLRTYPKKFPFKGTLGMSIRTLPYCKMPGVTSLGTFRVCFVCVSLFGSFCLSLTFTLTGDMLIGCFACQSSVTSGLAVPCEGVILQSSRCSTTGEALLKGHATARARERLFVLMEIGGEGLGKHVTWHTWRTFSLILSMHTRLGICATLCIFV